MKNIFQTWMLRQLRESLFSAICLCYAAPDAPGPYCRKPYPGMILQAQEEHQLDLEGSPIVGDKQSDMLFGKNAGRRNAQL